MTVPQIASRARRDAIIAIARNLIAAPSRSQSYGIFNMTGSGEATWAEFAEVAFAQARALGREPVEVAPILTAQYSMPAPPRKLAARRIATAGDSSCNPFRYRRIH